MNQQIFTLFRPTDFAIPFTFRYPVGWQIREIIEDNDVELFIAGPRNQANTFSAAFTIRLWPAPALTPQAAAEDFLERFNQRSGFQQTAQMWMLVNGNPALEVEISFITHLPMHSIRSEKTQIRERRIFLPFGDALLEFIYSATAEMYDDWLPAFYQLANSLTPIETPPEPIYTITGFPAAVPLQEPPPEYDSNGGEDDDAQP